MKKKKKTNSCNKTFRDLHNFMRVVDRDSSGMCPVSDDAAFYIYSHTYGCYTCKNRTLNICCKNNNEWVSVIKLIFMVEENVVRIHYTRNGFADDAWFQHGMDESIEILNNYKSIFSKYCNEKRTDNELLVLGNLKDIILSALPTE